MAAGDYAILVGIAKYADPSTFCDLQGPINDVALMTEWLTAADGGNVPAANITTIISPPAIPPGTDPDDFAPATEKFKREFKKLVRDSQGRFISRPGRLYLYFSGHGFCERKSLTPQATLYAANATREFPENIFGTYYALQVKDKALFSEIVLIMDCCRDAEVNRPVDIPAISQAGSSAAGDAKLFCIYATSKGGKAQERPIAERGNKVHGLLTHAFLKALKEARPDGATSISGSALKRHLLETWNTLCGDTPAPMPEFCAPSGADLQFSSQNLGILQGFEIGDFPGAPTAMEVFDGAKHSLGRCDLQPPPGASTVTWNGSGPSNLTFDGKAFSLRLQPSYYRYVLSGGLGREGLFAVEAQGGPNVKL